MAIKVEINKKHEVEKYPYIGESKKSGRIVIFTAPKSGVSLNKVDDIAVFTSRHDFWNEEEYKQIK